MCTIVGRDALSPPQTVRCGHRTLQNNNNIPVGVGVLDDQLKYYFAKTKGSI